MLIQRFDLNRNIVATSIFFNTAILPKKKLRFEPTLGSYNSGLKNYRITNNLIFGISKASAFIWHTLDTSEKFSNLRKKHLRLHSFGPLWTTSTGNQWEICEVGHLSCFIDFLFAFTLFVIYRYILDYAHFTFSNTI